MKNLVYTFAMLVMLAPPSFIAPMVKDASYNDEAGINASRQHRYQPTK